MLLFEGEKKRVWYCISVVNGWVCVAFLRKIYHPGGVVSAYIQLSSCSFANTSSEYLSVRWLYVWVGWTARESSLAALASKPPKAKPNVRQGSLLVPTSNSVMVRNAYFVATMLLCSKNRAMAFNT